MTVIYKIRNIVNEKCYIGKAKNFCNRRKSHISELCNNRHKNIHLQRAWNKYGKYNFVFEILQECSEETLCFWEDYWCKILRTHNDEYGYNLQKTNSNGKQGHAEETKIKIGKANKGKKKSDEEKKTMQDLKYKRVFQYDSNCNFLRVWNSMTEAANTLGINRMSISRSCRYKLIQLAGGFIWTYANDFEINNKIRLNRKKSVKQLSKDGMLIKSWNSISDASNNLLICKGDIIKCCKHVKKSAGGFIWEYLN